MADTNSNSTGNETVAPHPHPLTHGPATSHEGGILNGVLALQENISLLIVQILMILLLSRALGYLIHKINQPRVIAEVIAGILLGPTACGNIPGFTSLFFPASRISLLKLISDLGLIFFLFIVGLELDLNLLRKNARKALWISSVSMIIPFGVGAGIAMFLKVEVMTSLNVPTGSVILFIGVAYAITAFPVLARILTEAKLLSTSVGIVTISAAAVGDAAAWCLLALTVAIVGAKDPITSLYIFLLLLGFCAIMAALSYFVFRRISIPENPSQNLVMLSLVVCLMAAWITDFIGVHAIFGAFLAGVAMPRKQGFAFHLTEKIEDLVTIIFLPLYFAYSGLNTNIGLLNSGVAWGGVLLVIFGACISKFCSATFAAKVYGLPWRESFAIGILMNTKGLVELIVLNIGLQNEVIDGTVFTIMVLMALITTFMTSPLIKLVYPHKYHNIQSLTEQGKVDLAVKSTVALEVVVHQHILVVIPPVPPTPLLMNIIQMLTRYNKKTDQKLLVNTAQLIEVTDRYSSVIMASAENAGDDVINPFLGNLSRLEGIKVSNQKIISSPDHFHEDLVEIAKTEHLDAVFFPWHTIFTDGQISDDELGRVLRDLMRTCPCTIVSLVNKGLSIIDLSDTKILLPFLGGPDDREAVELALSFGREVQIIGYNSRNYDKADVALLDAVQNIAEKDDNVSYKVDNSDDFVESITSYAADTKSEMIVLGRGSPEGGDLELVLGKIGSKLCLSCTSLNMLVVKRGETSSKFLGLVTTEEED